MLGSEYPVFVRSFKEHLTSNFPIREYKPLPNVSIFFECFMQVIFQCPTSFHRNDKT